MAGLRGWFVFLASFQDANCGAMSIRQCRSAQLPATVCDPVRIYWGLPVWLPSSVFWQNNRRQNNENAPAQELFCPPLFCLCDDENTATTIRNILVSRPVEQQRCTRTFTPNSRDNRHKPLKPVRIDRLTKLLRCRRQGKYVWLR